jgi:hypothetical protein
LKEHLAGGYADTIMCLKTTTKIRKEIRTYLEKNKRNRPIFLDDDDGGHGQQQQEEEGQVGDGSDKTVVQPSSGPAAKRRGILLQQHPKTIQKSVRMLQASSEEALNKLWMIGVLQDHTKPPLKLPQSLRLTEIM